MEIVNMNKQEEINVINGQIGNALESINPKCKLCNNPPEKFKSYHYFLNLPTVETELRQWIDKASVEGNWTQNSRAITTGLSVKDLKKDALPEI